MNDGTAIIAATRRMSRSPLPVIALAFLLVAVGGTSGCQSTHGIQVDSVARNPGLGIRRFTVTRAWLKSQDGRGIRIEVWTQTDAQAYAPDPTAEITGAAQILSEVARTGIPPEWDYIDFEFHMRYGSTPRVTGSCRVIMRTKDLKELHARNAPLAEYSRHWQFIFAAKDPPGSDMALTWKKDPSRDD